MHIHTLTHTNAHAKFACTNKHHLIGVRHLYPFVCATPLHYKWWFVQKKNKKQPSSVQTHMCALPFFPRLFGHFEFVVISILFYAATNPLLKRGEMEVDTFHERDTQKGYSCCTLFKWFVTDIFFFGFCFCV